MKSFFVICLAYYFCSLAVGIFGIKSEDDFKLGSNEKIGTNSLNYLKETKSVEEEPLYDSDENNIEVNQRAMGMLRLGKRRPFSGRRLTQQQHQQLQQQNRLSENNEDEKRAMGMLRLGRGDEMKEEDKKAMGMLRLGRSYEDSQDGDDVLDKRAMGMLRLGRSRDDNLEDSDHKRAMGMLRLGRSIRLQKRDAIAAAGDA